MPAPFSEYSPLSERSLEDDDRYEDELMWSSIEAADWSSAVRVAERIGEVFASRCDIMDGRADEALDFMDAKVLGDGNVRAGGICVEIEGRN